MNKDLLDDAYGRLFEIPAELSRLGHEVAGLCLSYRPRQEGHLKGLGVDSTSVDWYSMNLGRLILPGGIRYLKRLSELTRSFKPDVIVACSDAIHAIIGMRLAGKQHIPCVVDLYDNFESYGLSRLPCVMSRFRKAVNQADGVTCVSRLLKNYVIESYHPSGLIKTVENGIPQNLFSRNNRLVCRSKFGLPGDAVIIGTAGAIDSSRGVDVLFKAFKELNIQNSSIHLALAGHVEPGKLIPQNPQIHYLGNLEYEDVPLFLNALDVGVICNLDSLFGRFCFPQKAYEMIACKIPVVAADVGATGELFKDYPDCLFAPGDSQNLIKILKNQIKTPIIPEIDVSTWPDLAVNFASVLKEVIRKKK